MNLIQDYTAYTREDHDTWAILFKRQAEIIRKFASIEFCKGFELLSLDPYRVARLDDVNESLEKISGWNVVPVNGLLPNREFFHLLINKKFPVTLMMRKPEELDFSKLPDIFHDIYGHVPMLMNPLFCDFMTEYSRIALRHAEHDLAVTYLGRFYWFTLEMGLIYESGALKAFGGAILTSAQEVKNCQHASNRLIPFDLERIMQTDYDNLKLQKEYFTIRSFRELFDSIAVAERLLGRAVLNTVLSE